MQWIAARVVLGTLWAGGLLFIGLLVWFEPDRLAALGLPALVPAMKSLALWAVSGAIFIFLVLVADALCPRTPIFLKGFLKTFTGAGAWMAFGWAMVQVFSQVG